MAKDVNYKGCNLHVRLPDGTSLNYPEEVINYLHDIGLSDNDLKYVFSGIFPNIELLKDDRDYWERVADGYYVACGNFIDELEVVVEKLKSGRSGRGYTKLDLALAIEHIIKTCDPREGC